MARKARHSKKKNLKRLAFSGLILLILIAGGITVVVRRDNSDNTVAPADSSGKTNPLDISAVNKENDARKGSSNPSDTLDTPSTPPSFTATITRVSAGDPVRAFTLINGVTSGSCELVASHIGQTNITATSTVAQSNNSYQCQDLSIPKSSFPASGAWHFVVNVTSGGSTASGSWDAQL